MILTPHRKDYHAYANQGCLLTAIYAYGDMPPRYPVPAVMKGAYVIYASINPDTGNLVVWMADGDVIAV